MAPKTPREVGVLGPSVRWAFIGAGALLLFACDGGGGGSDSGLDAARPDASAGCDPACDDGVFCNGVELCQDGACVDGEPPCGADESCDEAADECTTECLEEDADGDGVLSIPCGGRDCDDQDADRFPGNAEVCDADDHDEDCDASTFGIRDQDGDDEPDATCCNVDDEGASICGTDCDDARGGVAPGLPEACDGRDNDCDTAIDEDVLETYYPDVDGDGYGDPEGAPMESCFRPDGYADNDDDCDDAASGTNPGVGERCDEEGVDENCDSIVNPPADCMCTGGSQDCDELGACASGTELCVDGAWGACSISPILETCNGVDDDCSGAIDEGLTVPCYVDADNDGYAEDGAGAMQQCPDPSRVDFGTCPNFRTHRPPSGAEVDCNDANPTIRPITGTEICVPPGERTLATDEDCDGSLDEGVSVECYVDADEDGYAAEGEEPTWRCRDTAPGRFGFCPSGYTGTAPSGIATIDCAPAVAAINPGADEVCDAGMLDEDCDGDANPTSLCTCSGSETQPCPQPGVCSAGTQTCSGGAWGACSISPTTETCNGADDNCNGVSDDTFACRQGSTQTCARPACGAMAALTGTATCSGSCTLGACIATEVCNGCDDDVDGTADDGFACVFGSATSCTTACGTSGSQTCNGSCTGYNTCVAATEACNGCDDDGDGVSDEGFTCRLGHTQSCTTSCGTAGTQSCNAGCGGYSTCVAATETCNGCDDDGDGVSDDGFTCRLGHVQSCTTSCGTAGTQTCNAGCGGYSTCVASGESCNFCDDVGDGGDDRGVGTTRTATGSYAGGSSCSGLAFSGTAYCADFNNPANAMLFDQGTMRTTGTVRVGWSTLSASANVLLTDILSDGQAPAGTVDVFLSNTSTVGSTGYRAVGVSWFVDPTETMQLWRQSGFTRTVVATVSRTGIGGIPWTTFDTDGFLRAYTLSFTYRPRIDGANEQYSFSISTGGNTWTMASPATSTSTVFTQGGTVMGGAQIYVTGGPWIGQLQTGASLSATANTTCP